LQAYKAKLAQFLLRHVSVQTTERYLGCKRKPRKRVNDGIDLAQT